MNYEEFHGNKFLFVDTNEVEINHETNLPRLSFFQELQESLVKSCEVDLIMYYKHTGTFVGVANYKCSFFNKDGSEASLCGNALLRLMEIEGVGHYVFHTISGLYEGWNNENEMGLMMIKAKIIYEDCFKIEVDIGNPHLIVFDNEDDSYKCNIDGFNTHYTKQKNTNTFEVRCFERGVGETQACGSGAYAVGIAMIKHFKLSEVNIVMKGGKYLIKEGFLIVKK